MASMQVRARERDRISLIIQHGARCMCDLPSGLGHGMLLHAGKRYVSIASSGIWW